MSESSGIYSGIDVNNPLRTKLESGLGFTIFEERTDGKDKKKKMVRLFTFSGGISGRIEWSEESENIVRDAAERLGLIQLSTEFYPSSATQELSREEGVKFDDHRHSGWASWFERIAERATLFPDTNILLKHTLTEIILPRISENGRLGANNIVIPRMAILELENLANDEQKKERVSKGECFMAFNEIRTLKELGARLTEPLTPDDLSSFYSIAGKRLADAFLREEVRRYDEVLRAARIPQQRAIFLTRDMVSALSGNSEDLDIIYVAPKNPDQTFLNNVGFDEIRGLIVEVSTTCSSIILEWTDKTRLLIEGVWGGKNWYDYYNRRVRVTPMEQSTIA